MLLVKSELTCYVSLICQYNYRLATMDGLYREEAREKLKGIHGTAIQAIELTPLLHHHWTMWLCTRQHGAMTEDA